MGNAEASEDDALAGAEGGGIGDEVMATSSPQLVEKLDGMFSQRLAELNNLVDWQTKARGNIEALSRKALGESIVTIDVAQGIIAGVFRRLDRHIWSTEGDVLTRHLLLASFAASMNLTQVITIQGLYVPAATLVRQQMECLAELDTIESGKTRRKDKPAHVGALRWRLAKAYGSLSDIAHNDQHKLFQLFAEQQEAASMPDLASLPDKSDRPQFNIDVYPRFIEWKARQLLSQQACFSLIAAAHALCFMQDVSDEAVPDDDAALIQFLGRSLEMQGIVESVG